MQPPDNKKQKRGPLEHPGPWVSELWNHLEEIRTLRMQRKTWKQISKTLADKTPSVKITPRTVRNFFVRSRDPKLTLPAGLEHLRPIPPPQPAPDQPAREVHARKETPETKPDPLSTEVQETPDTDPFGPFNRKHKKS